MLKSPSPSRASLVRHSLHKLKRSGDKQHPCRTPFPICTLLVSPRSNRTLTFCSMYNLLINLLSRQSMRIIFIIIIIIIIIILSAVYSQTLFFYLTLISKVKVEFTLEQTTKAQGGSRCIALLFP